MSEHDRDAYRRALREFLDLFEGVALRMPSRSEHRLWAAGFLLRASRLLRSGLTIIAGGGPTDGVPALTRIAYEATIDGVWLLADERRLVLVKGELTRRQSTLVNEVWTDPQSRPSTVEDWAQVTGSLAPSARVPPLEQRVRSIADWVSEAQPAVSQRMSSDRHEEPEPIIRTGEPYRSSYLALYRHLSTYAIHGAGAVVELIDGEHLRLVPDPEHAPHVEPTEMLVLVGGLLADAASRLLADFERLAAVLGLPLVEWEVRRAALLAAVRAVIEDDPAAWDEYLDRERQGATGSRSKRSARAQIGMHVASVGREAWPS